MLSLILVRKCKKALDATDVPDSPSSVVTEFCDGFSCCSDWEYVEPQSFSLSKKRANCSTITQEEMRYESSQVKALPLSRRRMKPPTGRFVVADQMVQCERKNDHYKNDTVLGRKLQRESGS